MISLVQVSESPQGLALSYPWWIAAALALTALASLAVAVARRARLTRRWPISLAVVFAAWASFYVATFSTRLDDEGACAYAFMRYDHAVRWHDAADVYLEHRDGSHWQIVVVDSARRSFAFDVDELSVDERHRVMAFIVDRMPANAFAAPELRERHAPTAVRPASFLQDQQI